LPCASAQHFDIVNGFFNRCRDGAIVVGFASNNWVGALTRLRKKSSVSRRYRLRFLWNVRMVVGGADSQA